MEVPPRTGVYDEKDIPFFLTKVIGLLFQSTTTATRVVLCSDNPNNRLVPVIIVSLLYFGGDVCIKHTVVMGAARLARHDTTKSVLFVQNCWKTRLNASICPINAMTF